MKKLIPLILLTAFVGCGSTPIRTNADGTYTISAQFGSLNGSWEKASSLVNQQALDFCNKLAKKVIVIEEAQDGWFGITPQRARLKFKCN
ncbi:hypothetical protein N9S29_02890 [SAR86 cluster bacterium]|nr:hypothetical protein [SAR86 cluster bacterium]